MTISDRIRAAPIRSALLIAALLSIPCLWTPFLMDDLMHQQKLDAWVGSVQGMPGYSEAFGLPELYVFFGGDVEAQTRAIEQGAVPWWVLPELRISFLRPLSSLSLVVDRLIWGHWPGGYQVQNTLWWMLLITVYGMCWRRWLNPVILALALVGLAVDDSFFVASHWTANRNATVSLALGGLGLISHLRWREEGWRPGAVLAPVGLALGLAGGETALGYFGFVLAYELFGARTRRLVALVPAVLVGLGWLVVYSALDKGAYGSGIYVDPSREPLTYLSLLPGRMVLTLGSFFGSIPADVHVILPGHHPWLYGMAALVVAVAGWVLTRAWPELDEDTRHGLRWLLPGALLATLPPLATFPMDRLMLLPALGLWPALAVVIRHVWVRFGERQWWPGVLGPLLILRHFAMTPLMFVFGGVFFTQLGAVFEDQLEGMEQLPAEPSAAIIVHTSDFMVGVYLPMAAQAGGGSVRRWATWSLARSDHLLSRPDPRSLVLRTQDGVMLDSLFGRIFRGKEHELAMGEQVVLEGYTANVVETEDGALKAVRFEFEVPVTEAPF
ncbi:MAG: hypothetical protein QGG40_01725, partial [Myxococcota bacterium]|nr:hypothetical protein [Myxococcota bacterium]